MRYYLNLNENMTYYRDESKETRDTSTLISVDYTNQHSVVVSSELLDAEFSSCEFMLLGSVPDDIFTIIYPTSIHIENSYKIKRAADMKRYIKFIVKKITLYNKYNYTRTYASYIAEWKIHNWFYNLHLFRSHSKHVDLDLKPKGFFKLIYNVVSIFFNKFNYF